MKLVLLDTYMGDCGQVYSTWKREKKKSGQFYSKMANIYLFCEVINGHTNVQKLSPLSLKAESRFNHKHYCSKPNILWYIFKNVIFGQLMPQSNLLSLDDVNNNRLKRIHERAHPCWTRLIISISFDISSPIQIFILAPLFIFCITWIRFLGVWYSSKILKSFVLFILSCFLQIDEACIHFWVLLSFLFHKQFYSEVGIFARMAFLEPVLMFEHFFLWLFQPVSSSVFSHIL